MKKTTDVTQATAQAVPPPTGELTFEEMEKMTAPEPEQEPPGVAMDTIDVADAGLSPEVLAQLGLGGEMQVAAIPAGPYMAGQKFPVEVERIAMAPDFTPFRNEMIATLAAFRTELLSEIEKLRFAVGDTSKVFEAGIPAATRTTVYCPECDLQLEGGSATGIKGMPYVHSFQGSPKLGGAQCKYKGRKFEAPIVFLKLIPEPVKKTA